MTRILFAVRVGLQDWQEELITEDSARIEEASRWALANGFDRLRVAEVDLSSPVDFAATGRGVKR